LGVVVDGVFVGDDAGGFEGAFGVGAGELGVAGSEVYQHQVVVGAAALEAVAFLDQRVGE